MKVKANHALPAVLIGLCCAIVSGAAHAEGGTASQHAALRKACTEQGGRLEQSWMYNDQGMRWGELLSCSTGAGHITCQSDLCRVGRWVLPDGVTAADGRRDRNDGTVRFPADAAAFSAALAALSGK